MNELNFGRFNSLYDFFESFPTEASCIAFLESKRWENGVVSPYDPTSKVYKRGDGMYRCKNTGKNFNVRRYLKEQNCHCVSGSWLSTLSVITKSLYPPRN